MSDEVLNHYFAFVKVTWGRQEYPLWDSKGCRTSRYVGGVSNYLCECQKPSKCSGVQAAAQALWEEAHTDGKTD